MQAIFPLVILISWTLYRLKNSRKTVVFAWTLSLVFVLFGLYLPGIKNFYLVLNWGVSALSQATNHATSFLFGYLAGGPAPFEITQPSNLTPIAFAIFPLIIVIGAISSLLFHWGILPTIIRAIARFIVRPLGISGSLAFGASSSIFLGTIETPLIIAPLLKSMSKRELLALISASMATIAGTVMVLYASVLSSSIPDSLGHMVVASLASVPLAIIFSLAWFGEDNDQEKNDTIPDNKSFKKSSALEALTIGIQDGLQMVLGIVATLLVVIALVKLIDMSLLGLFGEDSKLTLVGIFSIPLRPLIWLGGVSWIDSAIASELFATKIIINEFMAYLNLSQLQNLSAKTQLVMLYTMCGFANLGSVGIIVGGMSRLVPSRIKELSSLCLISLFIGNIATWTTGMLVAILAN